jgi:hypothetical protein
MRTYHYSVRIGRGKTTFPTVAFGSLRGSLAFFLKRSWRTVPVARYLTNVSVCFIQLSKSCGESVLLSCVKTVAEQERGGTLNHAPLKTAYSSGSKFISSISKPKIILISASLIRPFNSISTTI